MGGFDQVKLETGADLLALSQLDQKLWAALSCPTQGLEFHEKTLGLIDTDGDGRIRAPDIIAATKWAGSVLKNPDDLIKGASSLPLSAIDDSTAEGQELLSSAKQILKNLGKSDATEITADDTADTAKIFSKTRFNGDGIIPADSADDEAIGEVIVDIITCFGSEEDRSGLPGVSQEKVDQFFAEAQTYSDWWKRAEDDTDNVLSYGDTTDEVVAIFQTVKAKVDDYFTRCRLVEFDPDAAGSLNPSKDAYEALSPKNLSTLAEEITVFPLAGIEAGKPLPMKKGINPAWAGPIEQFFSEIVKPIFGDKDSLNAGEWESLSSKFSAYEVWLSTKEGTEVEQLGLKRIRDLLAGNSRETITALIEKDKALAPESDAISSVDRLIHYHHDLHNILNNFVSFRDFYTSETKAIFQAGTLYLDSRSCDLCVKVDDVGKHSGLAQLSRTYLAYCDCTRKGTEKKLSIAAAFTNGNADNLRVGRNGVFYDRKGRDWDATIVKIVENPISVRQAFWAPYKRIARMISEQIAKMSAAREKAIQTKTAKVISETPPKPKTGQGSPGQAFDIAKFAGIFAAIGLAIGALGTAIASMLTGFMKLVWWQMPLAALGLLLAVSGPSMIVAYLKLRKRNLAPILDANGWAVNTRAMINIPFGASLTLTATLPPDSYQTFRDPFATKKLWKLWKLYILMIGFLIAAGVLFYKGYPQKWWKQHVVEERTVQVIKGSEPAKKPPQPAPSPK